ncbi:hypothetical protein N5V81_14120 [Escherichia coli]|nr:hypothetical protein [Escherichia coli]
MLIALSGSIQCQSPVRWRLKGLLHTGEYADWKGELPIHSYQEIYLNLRTLFRNAFYAFEERIENG